MKIVLHRVLDAREALSVYAGDKLVFVILTDYTIASVCASLVIGKQVVPKRRKIDDVLCGHIMESPWMIMTRCWQRKVASVPFVISQMRNATFV